MPAVSKLLARFEPKLLQFFFVIASVAKVEKAAVAGMRAESLARVFDRAKILSRAGHDFSAKPCEVPLLYRRDRSFG
jgi:hypothetical protein